jgi:hypothetical protein
VLAGPEINQGGKDETHEDNRLEVWADPGFRTGVFGVAGAGI